MPAISDAGEYLVVQVEGKTAQDIVETLKAAYRYPEYHQRNALWSFRNNHFEVSLEQLKLVTEFIRANYPDDAPRTRRAIVVSPGLTAGFAEVWASWNSDLPYDVRVFYSEAEATAWLRDAPVA